MNFFENLLLRLEKKIAYDVGHTLVAGDMNVSYAYPAKCAEFFPQIKVAPRIVFIRPW